jgi:uncharacterized coiled-coil protein SlyX
MLEKRLKLLSKRPFSAKCIEELEDVVVGIALAVREQHKNRRHLR